MKTCFWVQDIHMIQPFPNTQRIKRLQSSCCWRSWWRWSCRLVSTSVDVCWCAKGILFTRMLLVRFLRFQQTSNSYIPVHIYSNSCWLYTYLHLCVQPKNFWGLFRNTSAAISWRTLWMAWQNDHHFQGWPTKPTVWSRWKFAPSFSFGIALELDCCIVSYHLCNAILTLCTMSYSNHLRSKQCCFYASTFFSKSVPCQEAALLDLMNFHSLTP